MEKAPTPISQSKHDRYIVAHATTAGVAVLITMPAALLIGRYLRTWRHWNLAHAGLNFLTVVLIIITFALGNAALKDPNQYTGSHSDVHHKLGLAVFLIVVVQGIGGIGAKLLTSLPSYNYVTFNSKRHMLRYIHIALGIISAGLLYAQFYTGYQEWNNTSNSQTHVPRGFIIAFWVLFAVEVFFYLLGFPIMERSARKKRAAEISTEKMAIEKQNSNTPLV